LKVEGGGLDEPDAAEKPASGNHVGDQFEFDFVGGLEFFDERGKQFVEFGLGFVGIGVSLILYTIFNAKRHQAYIKMGANSVSIGQELIERYLESYWQKSFPHHSIPFYLTIRKHSLQIVADLPPLPESEQPLFLEKIKSDLSDLFVRVLGYPYDVHFIAHFQTNESELKMRSND
jgi:hypothetical protein